MKSAAIASVLACLAFCIPLSISAEESRPESAEIVQAQPDLQSINKAEPGEGARTKLEEVVVTATRLPTPAKELPVPVQVISRKDIEASRANDLSEVLAQYLPEHFQKYPGALTSVSIRGFRTNTMGTDIKGHVLVLIDGHRAGTGNIAVIPMENVERIEIVRGPGSVVYGSAAMGGVVNLITRKGKGDPSVNAGVEYGSWDYIKGGGGFSGGFLDNGVGVSVTGRTITQGSYDMGGGKRSPNTAYNDQAYSGSFFAAPSPEHTFFAVGSYFKAWDVGQPNPDYLPLDLVDTKDILRGYGSFGYDGLIEDWGMNWHLSYYNVLDQNRWNYPEAVYGYTSGTTEQHARGVRSQFSLPTFSFGRLLVGFDWDGIDMTNSTIPAGVPWGVNSRYDNYALLAEEKICLRDLTLLLGVRYDMFEERIEPTEGYEVRRGKQQFDHASWRTGLTYRLFDWLSGRAAVGTAFSIPAADQLAGRYEAGHWMKIIGNPDLKPESGTTYEAGLDAEVAGFTAGLGFFYTEYNDRITGGFPACVDGDCSWVTYRNVEGATLSGLEGTFSRKQTYTLNGTQIDVKPFLNMVFYTQRRIEDPDYADILKSGIVPYVPLWDAAGGVEITFNRKVSLMVNAFYAGEEKQENFNYLSSTYSQALDMGDFAVFSAKLSYRPVKYLELFVASDNITDRDYAFVNGYPMPGRRIRGGIEARF